METDSHFPARKKERKRRKRKNPLLRAELHAEIRERGGGKEGESLLNFSHKANSQKNMKERRGGGRGKLKCHAAGRKKKMVGWRGIRQYSSNFQKRVKKKPCFEGTPSFFCDFGKFFIVDFLSFSYLGMHIFKFGLGGAGELSVLGRKISKNRNITEAKI